MMVVYPIIIYHSINMMFIEDPGTFFEREHWKLVRRKILHIALCNLKKWFDHHMLTLNISKTKFMQISLNPFIRF